ncbi:aspartate-semialdehyde dehydrogenase [Chromobacterium subtsugae]|uniref:Aspartate-semialdehyde dehydrogenase n=1 Tax=Chromobacterium subtsugae TaxID=251747 RepID=A0ABS7FC49_9NEIS|nr:MULTISPECIES: aspartate-semialdehyde dehydrogenase [Chromobacterium]KUM03159.1 aspartate-semialdehyde dehydrogenase [Chromobacterium subtsugae]KZE85840.1 aspartate-semialdehyde dehydrogenase [Chromobacterium sp. F49]MBW7566489.1 aspartate-semialdehyde dehydrogenase [Chromobacterium subtsugae]MBW8287652.1 aspartate-semialdehyde dehydrogenase [Chromobacterium subtsugae]OBU85335.1 aspartate-semialdehyde dehydrogenase [Chromobacterium subtsugae]
MKKVGLVGWRGMVGSVLLQRMQEENDFHGIDPHFFSTSNAGAAGPAIHGATHLLKDANDIRSLAEMDIIITCQGGDYTKAIYPELKASGWQGYWIDAASALRMDKDSCIILDPVNRPQIDQAIQDGLKLFVGGNCSITLSLMGLAGLIKADLIEWMSLMTYQSASGAGAKQVRELIAQSGYISSRLEQEGLTKQDSILPLVKRVCELISSPELPTEALGAPLMGSIIPWIDSDLGDGNSREEWKGEVETNKILGLAPGTIPVNGLCVRVGVIRCHSAAITMKLKREVNEQEFAALVKDAHPFVSYVPNNKQQSVTQLTPAAISGSLKVGIGRYKKMSLGQEPIYSVLTVGDQLLWGAAEPLRRMLNILLGRA